MARGDGSKARREALRKHVTINPVMQSVAITKYYDMADRALAQAGEVWRSASALPAGTRVVIKHSV